MSVNNVWLAIVIMALITLLTRAFPFIFFHGRKPPDLILFIGKHIPPVVITILVIYCLKDVKLTQAPYGLCEILSVLAVVLLHLWRRNPFLSIFGATVFYMFLLQASPLSCLFN
ncbi:MAG: branched-chain amino acid transport [Firmicutes bacterium]|nr:branched-chain amino acid transport [Bacillota bacterium]